MADDQLPPCCVCGSYCATRGEEALPDGRWVCSASCLSASKRRTGDLLEDAANYAMRNPMPRLDVQLPPPVGYVPRAEADALVAAALRMAAGVAARYRSAAVGRCDAAEARGELPSDTNEATACTAGSIEAAILSLTPADAEAALHEVRRQAYREGWRFAFGQCKHTGSVPDPDHKQEDRK